MCKINCICYSNKYIIRGICIILSILDYNTDMRYYTYYQNKIFVATYLVLKIANNAVIAIDSCITSV